MLNVALMILDILILNRIDQSNASVRRDLNTFQEDVVLMEVNASVLAMCSLEDNLSKEMKAKMLHFRI
jgi:hypothetical protein